PVDLEVGLEPAPRGVEVGVTEVDAVDAGFGTARQSDARAPLGRGGVVQNRPLVTEEAFEVGCRGPHLLQGEDVDVAAGEPVAHPLAERGANAVDVDRGNTKWA